MNENKAMEHINTDKDSKKRMIEKWLIIVNVVVIVFLLFLFVVKILNKAKNQPISGEDIETSDLSVEKKINDSMGELYQSMIAGKKFTVDDSIYFSFDNDGKYSGFFDKDNKSVAGYTYDISYDSNNDVHMLNIYSDTKSSVSYEITIDEENIYLLYPGADQPFVLSPEEQSFVE